MFEKSMARRRVGYHLGKDKRWETRAARRVSRLLLVEQLEPEAETSEIRIELPSPAPDEQTCCDQDDEVDDWIEYCLPQDEYYDDDYDNDYDSDDGYDRAMLFGTKSGTSKAIIRDFLSGRVNPEDETSDFVESAQKPTLDQKFGCGCPGCDLAQSLRK